MNRICEIPGCNNIGAWNKRIGDKVYRRKLCSSHRRNNYGRSRTSEYNISLYKRNNTSCEICSWNKAPCDIHRIIPGKEGGRYVEENMITLCPNCRRMADYGLINLKESL